jgi:predicted HTH transcriptional regulator
MSEEFARFLEAPNREGLRDLLHRQSGEYDFLDFKKIWPERSELAKHILAFANSGNGCIVAGVAEREDKTFEIAGLPSLEDKTKLKDSVQKYLPQTIASAYEIHDFEYTESEYQQLNGKKFQVLLVVSNPDVVPLLSLTEGTSIKANRIYVRHNNSTREAEHSEVQALINKRIEWLMQSPVGRELHDHLAQLEALYARKLPQTSSSAYEAIFGPKAGFYRFLDKMIAKKQAVIEKLLNF